MIEQPGKKKMLLFSGSSNEELASNVASNLGTEVSTVESKEFASCFSSEFISTYRAAFQILLQKFLNPSVLPRSNLISRPVDASE